LNELRAGRDVLGPEPRENDQDRGKVQLKGHMREWQPEKKNTQRGVGGYLARGQHPQKLGKRLLIAAGCERRGFRQKAGHAVRSNTASLRMISRLDPVPGQEKQGEDAKRRATHKEGESPVNSR